MENEQETKTAEETSTEVNSDDNTEEHEHLDTSKNNNDDDDGIEVIPNYSVDEEAGDNNNSNDYNQYKIEDVIKEGQ